MDVNLDRPLEEYLESAIERIEESYIRKALERTNGHIGHCAQLCGLSRRSITIKMAQYQLDKAAFKEDLGVRERAGTDKVFA
jgi:DNA-binding NtrC family response regulator